jgi:putative transposase
MCCASTRRGRKPLISRRHGVSKATLYNWKGKFGGMDISEAKRLLEDENARRKKLLSEQMLEPLR